MNLSKIARFERYVVRGNGCWLWSGYVKNSGYGSFTYSTGKSISAHRFAYESYIGKIPVCMDVCHSCDNRICVRPSHLFVGTRKENLQDMVKKGRSLRGERHNMAKLKEHDVREIISAGGNFSRKELAKRFGADPSHISGIITGRFWKHIERIPA